MYCTYQKYTLHFKFLAGTSRGVLRHKDSFFIKVSQAYSSKLFGIGECGPLKGLSMDDRDDFEAVLHKYCSMLTESGWKPESEEAVYAWVQSNIDKSYPSIKFGMETALLDIFHQGRRKMFANPWSEAPHHPISINGLVWMGDKTWMLEQMKSKIDTGFDCIKMKIGAIDFDQEMELLSLIRTHYSADQITLRVDANGAFSKSEVYQKLERLAAYDVHSIEQPIAPRQISLMRDVCRQSPVPIALDEELIGITDHEEKKKLLDEINPQYIILKPTLLGGFKATQEWIDLAEERNIGWWITSALESNVGLNAIAQLTANYPIKIPQGLGTGQLYHNNFDSPLKINQGQLFYEQSGSWDLKALGV